MKLLSVTSEIYPLIKTGGLADVAGALPSALAAQKIDVVSLVPGYPAVMSALDAGPGTAEIVAAWDDLMGVPARLLAGKAQDLDLFVLDAPALFDRQGGPYGDADGTEWSDNWRRFAALGRVASSIAAGVVPGFIPDIVHAHDWQAALAPVYLRYDKRRQPSVMTIHNIAFQGQFAPSVFGFLNLPPQAFSIDGLEYYGDVSFLKGGLTSANAITTVSPTYAREIRTAEFGMGLEGVIAARGDAVSGIVNGIDETAWNPNKDTALAATYNVKSLAKRAENKRAIEAAFGLEQADGPIFAVVSRLSWQKGLDVLADALDDVVAMGGRLALLGSGDAAIETAFEEAELRHKGKIGCFIGYSEERSHLMQGGCDAILVPSRFEPCGLTQLYGLRYGCVPVVAQTGGLNDTVIDANMAALNAGVATGIGFSELTRQSLTDAIGRAIALHAQPSQWKKIQQNGMKTELGWDASAAGYAALYKTLG